jgi:serine/threonine-protein kinase
MSRPSHTVTVAPVTPEEPAGTPSLPPSQVQLEAPDATSRQAEARYSDGTLIGEGGMGKVLLVRDRYVGRQIALKQLKDEQRTNGRALARFDREARLQGQLEHPAIVPVYDIGKDPDGSPFFTMKHVKGESLAELLDDVAAGKPTRFSRRKLLSAFSQLCVAVHYAHERGVVHRDIKPANIMLGAYGEVYLLDWGVAKVGGETAEPLAGEPTTVTDDAIHTGSGTVVGTLSTMAPEQALGRPVDARTDVYALGAVLFHILTGEPFHPKGEFAEVVGRILGGVEARASVRVPDVDVAPELEELCVAATRLHPSDRLASAAALHQAIEAYLDGDRDQELRRAAARKHSDAARAAADTILGRTKGAASPVNDEATHARALGEVGKALAFDPDNKDALGTLVELLTSPPKVVPREVEVEERAMTKRRVRMGGIAAAAVYGYISLNAFTTWQLGVHDIASFTTAHVLWGCAFVCGLVTIWKSSYVPLFITFLFGISACFFVTSIYSPYLMVPPLLTMHAVLFALVQSWRLRIVMIVLASCGWTASVFGEHWRLLPTTVRFTNGDMLIHSPVISLPETLTTLYLWISVLAMIIAPAVVIGSLRTAWMRSEQAMRLQLWQLRRLVVTENEAPARPPTR